MTSLEALRHTYQGIAPFEGWSIDLAGPFPPDYEGRKYLIVAVDPFTKWVEAAPIRDKRAWRTAEFLWGDIICRWGKPAWIRTDNGTEFKGMFNEVCTSLGIKHRCITVLNSKANGQVERAIRVIKESIRKLMTQYPDSHWSDHLGTTIMAMRFATTRAHGLPPFMLVTG